MRDYSGCVSTDVSRGNKNQRAAQLADVIVGIVAKRGVDAVSVREVAAGAGVSIGTVQHYFPTKDQMLAFAVDRVGELITARIQEITAGPTVGEGMRKVLMELLPLDTQRQTEAKIWLSFLARAIFTPDLLRRARQTGRRIEEQITETIRRAQDLGEANSDIEAARAAKVLYALIDGLTVRALTDPERIDPEETTAILDSYLYRVFPTFQNAV